ncbi:MAG: hypothetical protein ACU0CI_03540 [Shimia sp.]
MSLFSLGPSAFVTAGHFALVFLLLRGMALGLRVMATRRTVDMSDGLILSIYATAAAFLLERGYYITARIGQQFGWDLWSAHPGPELMVALINASIVALLGSWRYALQPPDRAFRGAAIDCGGTALLMVGLGVLVF